MNKMLLLATVFMGVIAIGLGMTLWMQTSQKNGLLRPDDAVVTQLGKVLYAEQCASCHGLDLEGEANWQTPDEEGYLPAPPHDETGHTWHHSDADLFGLTKYGIVEFAKLKNHKSNMPAYEAILTDVEIIAVLSYIKSTWPDEIRHIHDQRNAVDSNR